MFRFNCDVISAHVFVVLVVPVSSRSLGDSAIYLKCNLSEPFTARRADFDLLSDLPFQRFPIARKAGRSTKYWDIVQAIIPNSHSPFLDLHRTVYIFLNLDLAVPRHPHNLKTVAALEYFWRYFHERVCGNETVRSDAGCGNG